MSLNRNTSHNIISRGLNKNNAQSQSISERIKTTGISIAARLAVILAFYQTLTAARETAIYGIDTASNLNFHMDFDQSDFPAMQQNLAACNTTTYDMPPANTSFIDYATIKCHSPYSYAQPVVEFFIEAGRNLSESLQSCIGGKIEDMCKDYYDNRFNYNYPPATPDDGMGIYTFLCVVGGIALVGLVTCLAITLRRRCKENCTPHHTSSDSPSESYYATTRYGAKTIPTFYPNVSSWAEPAPVATTSTVSYMPQPAPVETSRLISRYDSPVFTHHASARSQPAPVLTSTASGNSQPAPVLTSTYTASSQPAPVLTSNSSRPAPVATSTSSSSSQPAPTSTHDSSHANPHVSVTWTRHH